MIKIVLTRLKENYKDVLEAYEVVGTYEFAITGLNRQLKVKVVKSYPGGLFTGLTNLEVRGENCATYYRSFHPKKTKEQAIQDAISSFLVFFSEKADVKEATDW